MQKISDTLYINDIKTVALAQCIDGRWILIQIGQESTPIEIKASKVNTILENLDDIVVLYKT